LHRTTESARAVDPKREAFARRARSATSGAPAAAREFIAKRAATSRGRVTGPAARRDRVGRARRERGSFIQLDEERQNDGSRSPRAARLDLIRSRCQLGKRRDGGGKKMIGEFHELFLS
jgi:hypothetical protein